MWKTSSLMQFKAMPHQRISILKVQDKIQTPVTQTNFWSLFLNLLSPISLREQGKFHTMKDDTDTLAKQHNKWIQKFSSGRNGINFSDIWCTITRNVEQRKGCTLHEKFTDHSMLKKCTPSVLLYHNQQSLLPT